MSSPNLRFVHAAFLAAFLNVLLVGCATIGERAASSGELGSAQSGGEAAVLFHFIARTPSGKALTPFQSGIEESNLAFFIGDADTNGVPSKEIVPGYISGGIVHRDYLGRFLSKEARADGWITLFLRPGYYYLVVTTIMQTAVFADWPPRWRIEVPPGTPVIYAGTFNITAEASWWTWPEWGKMDQTATKISDETDIARAVAKRDLALLPPPITRLVKEQSGPYLFGIPPLAAN